MSMSALLDPEASETVVRIGLTLMHFVWQGALIGAFYALLRLNLRMATPQTRYLLGLLTLSVLACTPIITFLSLAATPEFAATPITQDAAAAHLITADQFVTPAASGLNALLSWITCLWLAGVAVFATRMIFAWSSALHLRADSYPGEPRRWDQLLGKLCAEFGVDRRVSLALSAKLLTPAVIGWLRPVILMPPSVLSGLSTDQIEMIVLHELAHIRRHDYLINALQMVLETLLFYHPVIHWVSNQTRAEREYCCDDMVVEFCGNRIGYVKTLAALETRRLQWKSAMTANGGSLLKRVQRIANPEHGTRIAVWPFMLAAVAALSMGYSIHVELTPVTAPFTVAAEQKPAAIIAATSEPPSLNSIPAMNPVMIAALKQLAATSTSVRLPAPPRIQLSNPVKLAALQFKTIDTTRLSVPSDPERSELIASFAPAPDYPYEQLRDNTSGNVRIAFKVTDRGYVADISTEIMKGPVAFSDAARQAVSRWKFNPPGIEHESATPRVEFTMVFAPNSDGRTSVCVKATGSRICHRYSISIENTKATLQYGNAVLVANTDANQHISVIRKNPDGSTCRWNRRTGCESGILRDN